MVSRPARGSGPLSRASLTMSSSVAFSSQPSSYRPGLPGSRLMSGSSADSNPSRDRATSPSAGVASYLMALDQRSGGTTPRSSGSSPGAPARVSAASRTSKSTRSFASERQSCGISAPPGCTPRAVPEPLGPRYLSQVRPSAGWSGLSSASVLRNRQQDYRILLGIEAMAGVGHQQKVA